MHDYHKAKEIVDYAAKVTRSRGKNKVTKITIHIGDSSGYSAESVKMYFQEISEKTICRNAELESISVKPALKCPKCNKEFPRKLMQYNCPDCGIEGLPCKTGTEVTIGEIEN